MDFFESFPAPPAHPEPPPTPPRPKWKKPAATLPVVMAENAIIVRDERLALSIGGLSAYPNGFEFSIHIRLRNEENLIDPFGHRRRRDYDRNSSIADSDDPERNLRVGILFADGRRAASSQPRRLRFDSEPDPETIIMLPGHGGGGGTSWDMSYWIHPLPPEGPLTIVLSWLAQDITEVRHELDGSTLLAAAAQAIPLWPEPRSGT
ncbi:hypothetical protein ABH926_006232 [Catenulispora sp. GP43]|uniref:hypothetical protein n=1 Tax=Catenulispora sp. GP43 TaxID=3156263 RepID=UPI003516332E